MTTTGRINGFPFSYLRKHSEHTIRLGKYETPGKWGCAIDQFRAGGIDFTIDVLAKSVSELDNILAAIMTEGSGSFSPGFPHEGWYYPGVAGDLSSDLRLSQYVPDKSFPLSFLFCSDLPFMLSDVVHSRGKYLDADGAMWSTDDAYPGNLLNNFSFEEWSNGTENACPDKWALGSESSGGSRSTDAKLSTYSYLVVGDGETAARGEISQSVPVEAGKTYKIGCWIKVSGRVTGTANLELVVDGSTVDSETVSADSDFVWVDIDYTFTTMPADATLRIYVGGTPGLTESFYFDGVVFTEFDNYENNTFGNQITTAGKVETIPDIEVTAAYLGATGVAPGASYTKSDVGDTQSHQTTSWDDYYTITIPAVAGVSHRIDVAKCKQWTANASYAAWLRLTLQNSGWNGGAEGTILEYSTNVLYANMVMRDSVTYGTGAITCDENSAVTIKMWLKATSSSYKAYGKYFSVNYTEISGSAATFPEDLAVYNTADPLTKMQVANLLYPGSRIRINADDTGTYKYSDDFSTNTYSFVATISGTVTYSADNKNIVIADTAYLRYPFDIKNPVTGIPELILYVNSGKPQVSIALDSGGSPGTFYAVDNNPTVDITNNIYTYLLNNAANLPLKNSTKFYVKIIPPSGEICTISAIDLYCDMVTVDVERPKISLGVSNEFAIEMSDDVGVFVSLYYNDRKVGI
jgi:Carbohydrate binding domain